MSPAPMAAGSAEKEQRAQLETVDDLPDLLQPSLTTIDPVLMVVKVGKRGIPLNDFAALRLITDGRPSLTVAANDQNIGLSTPLYGLGVIFVVGTKF